MSARARGPERYKLEHVKARGGADFVLLRGAMVRIFSNEHVAWWKAERAGYTMRLVQAGIYSFADAWNATSHCGPDKGIVYEVVESDLKTLTDDAQACARRAADAIASGEYVAADHYLKLAVLHLNGAGVVD